MRQTHGDGGEGTEELCQGDAEGQLALSPSHPALRVPSWHGPPTWPGRPRVAQSSPPPLQNPHCPSRSGPFKPLPRRGPAGGCSHPLSLPDRAAAGCSSPWEPEPTSTYESRVRVGRWQQSAGSPDPREPSDTFPHQGWIPPAAPLCQVELVALMAASESCAGAPQMLSPCWGSVPCAQMK